MLQAAHAAAFHWSGVGTELHVARAEQLLAQVYALLDQGDMAMHYAKRNLEFVMGRESPPWELAFSHAVMAHAASKAGNPALHATEYGLARSLGESLEDPDEREIFRATFDTIPRP